jgi:hypothetical protein
MSLWFQVPHTVSNLEGVKAVGAFSNKQTPARQVLKECRMLMMDWSYETWHWRFPLKKKNGVGDRNCFFAFVTTLQVHTDPEVCPSPE